MHPPLPPELRVRLLETPPPLRDAIRELGSLAPGGLWARVAVEDRVRGLQAFLEGHDGEPDRQGVAELRRWLARVQNFRPKTVERWAVDDVVARAARQSVRARVTFPFEPIALLVALHVQDRRPMLAHYLDLLGIPHEDGRLADLAPITGVDPDRARDAFLGTLHSFEPQEVVLYLLTLGFQSPQLCTGVREWLPALLHEAETGISEDAPGVSPGSPAAGDAGPGPDTPGSPPPQEGDDLEEEPAEEAEVVPTFTTLDQVIIRAVVAALQGVEGALDEERIDELVEEVLELNATRQRSHFHLGFVDGLREREYRPSLPAENEERRTWYLAGFLTGLARQRRWEAVLGLVDDEPMMERLRDSDARGLALPLVAEALLEAGRSGEIATWLPPEVLARTPPLARRLKERVTGLLREGRPADARGLLDLLDRSSAAARALGYVVPRPFLLELKRRRAHVHRQLGEHDEARRLLEELLKEDRSPDVQAMAYADLGLVAGGFRSLADIRVPPEADRRAALRDRLERGRTHFEASAREASPFAGHGHYPLGVLRVLAGAGGPDWSAAADHLERGLAAFEAAPDRYDPETLLPTARLYLGLALVLGLDPARVPRGIQLLKEVVEGGREVPEAHVEELVEALVLVREDGIRTDPLVEVLCRGASGRMLDLLARSPLAPNPAVVRALRERAADSSRPGARRAADHGTLVPLLLQAGRVDEARSSLDALEELAHLGSGAPDLLELLEEGEALDPAWEEDDVLACRVTLLEREGRMEEAARALVPAFHRVLSEDRPGAEDSAGEILARIRRTGALAPEETEPLRSRLEAVRTERGPDAADAPPAGTPRRPVRVLFIGGDERQEKTQEWLREELARRHPHIQVTFRHPGWGGNWGPALEDALRRAADHDAAVLMRFVRTEFGRALRKAIPIPWVFCWGPGRETMLRSIVNAGRVG